MGLVQPGDLIICRFTAPMVELALRLIANKIPAKVRGRSILTSIKATLRAVTELGGFTWAKFGDYLEIYRQHQLKVLELKDATDNQIATLTDRIDGVKALFEACPSARSADDLVLEAEKLTTGAAAVELSTVHRVKGFQAHWVVLRKPEAMPL